LSPQTTEMRGVEGRAIGGKLRCCPCVGPLSVGLHNLRAPWSVSLKGPRRLNAAGVFMDDPCVLLQCCFRSCSPVVVGAWLALRRADYGGSALDSA
jgi:hypothetical protein